MFEGILEKFAEKSAVTVMVAGLIERVLNADAIDVWFEKTRQRQYTRELLFSTVMSLMLEVVCQVRNSVYAAYKNREGLGISVASLYNKLNNLEPATAAGLVAHVAQELSPVIHTMQGENPPWLPGYRVKLLDGNCIEASEHRLNALRAIPGGALPGKALVVFDPVLALAIQVFPCEDGHAQERSVLSAVYPTIEANDVFIADRNFCTQTFLGTLQARQAYFVIREHQSLPLASISALKYQGHTDTGMVSQQQAVLHTPEGTAYSVRRITVQLHTPTREGDTEIIVLTNLPETVTAVQIAELYRKRWGIEGAFQQLEAHFQSEINTLGYPKAALFGFCLALVAFNIYSTVMAALRGAYPEQDINDTISPYYIAHELSRVTEGMRLVVPDTAWAIFRQSDVPSLSTVLLDLAKKMNLKKYTKAKRGVKKPPAKKTQFIDKPHVSTLRVLLRTQT